MALKPHDKGVDYVEFAAADFDAVKCFYETAFGWTFTDYGPEYTAFDDGRLAGGFRRCEPVSGTTMVILFAKDLEAREQAVRGAGSEITEPIFSFPGGRRFHFKDPAGNILAVWSDG